MKAPEQFVWGRIKAVAANLVPAKDLANEYTLVAASYYETRLIGLSLMAPLMAVADIEWVFLRCTLFYFLGLRLVLQIKTISTRFVFDI